MAGVEMCWKKGVQPIGLPNLRGSEGLGPHLMVQPSPGAELSQTKRQRIEGTWPGFTLGENGGASSSMLKPVISSTGVRDKGLNEAIWSPSIHHLVEKFFCEEKFPITDLPARVVLNGHHCLQEYRVTIEKGFLGPTGCQYFLVGLRDVLDRCVDPHLYQIDISDQGTLVVYIAARTSQLGREGGWGGYRQTPSPTISTPPLPASSPSSDRHARVPAMFISTPVQEGPGAMWPQSPRRTSLRSYEDPVIMGARSIHPNIPVVEPVGMMMRMNKQDDGGIREVAHACTAAGHTGGGTMTRSILPAPAALCSPYIPASFMWEHFQDEMEQDDFPISGLLCRVYVDGKQTGQEWDVSIKRQHHEGTRYYFLNGLRVDLSSYGDPRIHRFSVSADGAIEVHVSSRRESLRQDVSPVDSLLRERRYRQRVVTAGGVLGGLSNYQIISGPASLRLPAPGMAGHALAPWSLYTSPSLPGLQPSQPAPTSNSRSQPHSSSSSEARGMQSHTNKFSSNAGRNKADPMPVVVCQRQDARSPLGKIGTKVVGNILLVPRTFILQHYASEEFPLSVKVRLVVDGVPLPGDSAAKIQAYQGHQTSTRGTSYHMSGFSARLKNMKEPRVVKYEMLHCGTIQVQLVSGCAEEEVPRKGPKNSIAAAVQRALLNESGIRKEHVSGQEEEGVRGEGEVGRSGSVPASSAGRNTERIEASSQQPARRPRRAKALVAGDFALLAEYGTTALACVKELMDEENHMAPRLKRRSREDDEGEEEMTYAGKQKVQGRAGYPGAEERSDGVTEDNYGARGCSSRRTGTRTPTRARGNRRRS